MNRTFIVSMEKRSLRSSDEEWILASERLMTCFTMDRFMAKFSALALVLLLPSLSLAHHPDRRYQPVRPRVDVIGPVGNRLPPEYRRVYNRPTNIGGKIAYLIAPTSQEAMVWHRDQHEGRYNGKHCPRVDRQYFYPKPWEALRVGPRPDPNPKELREPLVAPIVEPEPLSEAELEDYLKPRAELDLKSDSAEEKSDAGSNASGTDSTKLPAPVDILDETPDSLALPELSDPR